MMRRMLWLTSSLYRLGGISLILLFDVLLLLIVFIDIARFVAKGYSPEIVGHMSLPTSWALWSTTLATLLVIGALLPMAIGLVIATSRPDLRLPRMLSLQGPSILVVHAVLSFALAASVIQGHQFEIASGRVFDPHDSGVVFRSFVLRSASLTSAIAAVVFPLFGSSMVGLLMYRLRRKQFPTWAKKLRRRVELESVEPAYRPRYVRNGKALCHGGIAPRLRHVDRHAERVVAQYERLGPGSQPAGLFLAKLAAECRSRIKTLLLTEKDRNGATIELVPGTSRALEIALGRCADSSCIIVSPYEHPSELEVVRWYCSNTGRLMRHIEFAPHDFELPKDEQLSKLVACVSDEIRVAKKRCVLLLSQVWWVAGYQLPIGKIVSQIRERTRGVPAPYVIVDGAHAAGNMGDAIHLRGIKTYLFSGHKWLAASEGCGVLMSLDSVPDLPYDAWRNDLPITHASARVIGGLDGALCLLEKQGIAHRRGRSELLLQAFLERVSPHIVAVGRNTGMLRTALTAIRPVEGRSWKWPDETGLRNYLQAHGLAADLVSVTDTPWIRLGFPFFLTERDAREVADVVSRAVSEQS